jgi:hypothetical protein
MIFKADANGIILQRTWAGDPHADPPGTAFKTFIDETQNGAPNGRGGPTIPGSLVDDTFANLNQYTVPGSGRLLKNGQSIIPNGGTMFAGEADVQTAANRAAALALLGDPGAVGTALRGIMAVLGTAAGQTEQQVLQAVEVVINSGKADPA